MNYKQKTLKALSEMSESECEKLFKYIPARHKMTDNQKNCIHSMHYDLKTGGSTCSLCKWMS